MQLEFLVEAAQSWPVGIGLIVPWNRSRAHAPQVPLDHPCRKLLGFDIPNRKARKGFAVGLLRGLGTNDTVGTDPIRPECDQSERFDLPLGQRFVGNGISREHEGVRFSLIGVTGTCAIADPLADFSRGPRLGDEDPIGVGQLTKPPGAADLIKGYRFKAAR